MNMMVVTLLFGSKVHTLALARGPAHDGWHSAHRRIGCLKRTGFIEHGRLVMLQNQFRPTVHITNRDFTTFAANAFLCSPAGGEQR